jgi:hypothetical protein
VATARADVPAESSGWVDFALKASLQKNRNYFVYLPLTAHLSWHLYRGRIAECHRGYLADDGLMHAMPECYKFRLTPGGQMPAAALASLGPENVNKGWNRAVHGVRNAWVPDLQSQKLPQWVELDLPEPAEINSVHVSFQTRKDRGVNFDVQARVASGWKSVAEVRGNADRRRVLGFSTVQTDKIRLVLLETAGNVGVCEIRLYRESQ